VLIVDDDPTSIQISSLALRRAGFCVCCSTDGRHVLASIEKFEPDVVLLDLVMPGRDGFELCRLIRTNARTAKVSVIMITGMNDSQTRQRGIRCGANDYITKPFETEDLIIRVTNAAKLKRAEESLRECRRELYEVRNIQRDAMKEFMERGHDFLEKIEERLDGWAEEEEEEDPIAEHTGPVRPSAAPHSDPASHHEPSQARA
jgi:DNA-binding response OmpR family regulator